MDFRQLGEGPHVVDVVADHATTILDPRVRAESSATHADADANATPSNAMSLEHSVEGDGPDQTEGPEHSIVPGATYGQPQLLSTVHHSGLDSRLRGCDRIG